MPTKVYVLIAAAAFAIIGAHLLMWSYIQRRIAKAKAEEAAREAAEAQSPPEA